MIQFQELDISFYNLAFGDENVQTKEVDDLIVTNNGDTEKVLVTVVRAVYLFTDEHPQSWIYIEGSTLSRTRLYQIGINKFLNSLTESFEIFGQLGSQWIIYNKQNRYRALIARRKNKYF